MSKKYCLLKKNNKYTKYNFRYLLGGNEKKNIPNYNDSDEYLILPLYKYGVSNRLFTLINMIECMKENNITKKLKVIWCNNHEVSYENVFDYIEPIENVEHVVECHFNSNHMDRFSHQFFRKVAWKHDYKYTNSNITLIKPNSVIKPELKKHNKENYNAIHIRRSDYGKHFSGSDEYMKTRIKDCKNSTYIATDSQTTKDFLFNEYKDRVFFNKEEMKDDFRKTSLKVALIDMFMCIYADNFIMADPNNIASTFTGFINVYRDEIGTNLKKMRYLLGGNAINKITYNDCDQYFVLPLYKWGLCNRLLTLLQCMQYLKEKNINKKIKAIWCNNNEVAHGNITELIDPITNVDILINCNFNSSHYDRYDKFFYMWKNNDDNNKDSISDYITNIKLKPELQMIIDKLKTEQYQAVHIRRTDHHSHKKDDFYIDQFDKNIKNIFLATDSINTKESIRKIYPNLITYDGTFNQNNFRQTTLKHAIIDLFMCINSTKFISSKHNSTFSIFSNIYRKRIGK